MKRAPLLRIVVAIATLAVGAAAYADLAADLASGERPQADKDRDAGRKPADVLAFVGIEPGMTVVDLVAAGGYYTEVLSAAVGQDGKVYAQNPPIVLKFRDGANDKSMTARLAGDRLPNVERVDRNLAESGLEPGSIDAAFTALNFHDIYNNEDGGPAAAAAFLADTYALLKPGGVMGIVDHQGAEGADNASLHRVPESVVLALVEASPFELEASGDLLRNPDDDHSKNVFDPGIRGHTDRFVLRLRKPAS